MGCECVVCMIVLVRFRELVDGKRKGEKKIQDLQLPVSLPALSETVNGPSAAI